MSDSSTPKSNTACENFGEQSPTHATAEIPSLPENNFGLIQTPADTGSTEDEDPQKGNTCSLCEDVPLAHPERAVTLEQSGEENSDQIKHTVLDASESRQIHSDRSRQLTSYEKLQKKNEDLEKERKRREDVHKTLIKNNEDLKKRLDETKEQLRNVESKNNCLESTCDNLNKEKLEIEGERNMLQKKTETLSEEKNNLQRTSEEEVNRLRTDHQRVLKDKETQVKSLELKKNHFESKCDNLEKEKLEIEGERNMLQNRTEALSEEQNKLQSTFEEEMKKLNTAYQKALKDKEAHVKTLEEQKKTLKTAHQKVMKDKEAQVRTLAAEKNKLNTDYKKVVNDKEAEIRKNQEATREYDRYLKDRQQQIDTLERFCEEKSTMCQAQERSLQEFTRTNQYLATKVESLVKHISMKEARITKLETDVSKMEADYNKLDAEKKELLMRLSKMAGERLTEANPAIADLSDVYRPTKLAEMFSEVYDNEWTDAFEERCDHEDEEDSIIFILNVLHKTYDLCKCITRQQQEDLLRAASTLKIGFPGQTLVAHMKTQTEEVQYDNNTTLNETLSGQNERFKETNTEEPKDGIQEQQTTEALKTQPTRESDTSEPTDGFMEEHIMEALRTQKEPTKEGDKSEAKDYIEKEQTTDVLKTQNEKPDDTNSTSTTIGGSESEASAAPGQAEEQELTQKPTWKADGSEPKDGIIEEQVMDALRTQTTTTVFPAEPTDRKEEEEKAPESGKDGVFVYSVKEPTKETDTSEVEDYIQEEQTTDALKTQNEKPDGANRQLMSNVGSVSEASATPGQAEEQNLTDKTPDIETFPEEHVDQTVSEVAEETSEDRNFEDGKEVRSNYNDEDKTGEDGPSANKSDDDLSQEENDMYNDLGEGNGTPDEASIIGTTEGNSSTTITTLGKVENEDVVDSSQNGTSVDPKMDTTAAGASPRKDEVYDDGDEKGSEKEGTSVDPKTVKIDRTGSDSQRTTDLNQDKDLVETQPEGTPVDPQEVKDNERDPDDDEITTCGENQTKDIITTEVKEVTKKLDDKELKALKEIQKATAFVLSEDVEKTVTEILKVHLRLDEKALPNTVAYLRKCVFLCWKMVLHDPPLYVEHVAADDSDPNLHERYRAYTKTGNKLQYLVWPALFLHKDGAVLNKGVAQFTNI